MTTNLTIKDIEYIESLRIPSSTPPDERTFGDDLHDMAQDAQIKQCKTDFPIIKQICISAAKKGSYNYKSYTLSNYREFINGDMN